MFTSLRSFYFVAIGLLLTLNAAAQIEEARHDMLQINKAYDHFEKLSMDVVYLLYAGHQSDVVFERQSGRLEQKGSDSRYKLGPIETLHSGNVTLSIDREEELMLVEHRRNESPSALGGYDLDQALAECQSIVVDELGLKMRSYSLYQPTEEVERIDIVFNTTSYLLEKLVLFYRSPVDMLLDTGAQAKEKPRIEIRFENINGQPFFPRDAFSLTTYIKGPPGAFTPQPAYAKFQFIDHTKSKLD